MTGRINLTHWLCSRELKRSEADLRGRIKGGASSPLPSEDLEEETSDELPSTHLLKMGLKTGWRTEPLPAVDQ